MDGDCESFEGGVEGVRGGEKGKSEVKLGFEEKFEGGK